MFKFGRQRSTINILSTLGEEKNKIGENFDEEEEHMEVIKDEQGEDEKGDDGKVIVRLREKRSASGDKARTRSNSVLESPTSLVLRGRDGRGAPRWMLERSRSAYIKPR